jgi:hypothetical protein
MPFKVRLKDINPQSLAKRIQEKLHAGYSLHTDITPVNRLRNDYTYRDNKGQKYSFAGNETLTNYYAVVVKE